MHGTLTLAMMWPALMLAGGCDSDPIWSGDPDPIRWAVFEDDVPSLVEGNDRFAIDLYAQLAASNDGNVVFSPASVAAALAMTVAGAAGETAQQMRMVMHVEPPGDRVHGAWALHLRQLLEAGNDEGTRLRIANRLWGQSGYGFLPEFLRMTREEYGAELATADFASRPEAAREEINGWVNRQTDARVPELFARDSLDASIRLVLVNAIWFKGRWATPFDEDATRDDAFRLGLEHDVRVPMMSQTRERFRYAETDAVQVLELPYVGGSFSMVIVLPRAVDGLADIEAGFSVETLDAWIEALDETNVDVWLPRFEMRTRVDLEQTLRDLGMSSPFEPGVADFSRVDGSRSLFIVHAVHEAWIRVDEEGTEAAAATGIALGYTAMPMTKHFRADHPFMVLVRHEPTGSILFLGRVVDPS